MIFISASDLPRSEISRNSSSVHRVYFNIGRIKPRSVFLLSLMLKLPANRCAVAGKSSAPLHHAIIRVWRPTNDRCSVFFFFFLYYICARFIIGVYIYIYRYLITFCRIYRARDFYIIRAKRQNKPIAQFFSVDTHASPFIAAYARAPAASFSLRKGENRSIYTYIYP